MKRFLQSGFCFIVLIWVPLKGNGQEAAMVSDFDAYLSTLEHIPLPFKHEPKNNLPELSKNYDRNGFEKYRSFELLSYPVGIYYRDSQTVGIIDCYYGDIGTVPVLTTYDLQGNLIGHYTFYQKSAKDMGYHGWEHLYFNRDRLIIVIDSVREWDVNEATYEILEGSLKLSTGKTVYRVMENGRTEIVRSQNISDPTNQLNERTETLELAYLIWGCSCPNWITTRDRQKHGESIQHCLYIEPADSSLAWPATSFDPAKQGIRVTGQFYEKEDYPKGTPEQEEPMPKARVFRYSKLEIISLPE